MENKIKELKKLNYILMDVEGTTTSIDFVHDVLFPYSAKKLNSFIFTNETLVKVFTENVKETALIEDRTSIDDKEVIERLLSWIKEDRKHPALKKIQGMIWEEGYKRGELKGHVYEDVPNALKKWRELGIFLGIYSSGSVQAQRSLFGHSLYGDLNPYFSHNFDTAVGGKREIQSYELIAKKIGYPANEILFLSDIKEELDAARSAGFQTTQLVRLQKVPHQGHFQVSDFSEIALS